MTAHRSIALKAEVLVEYPGLSYGRLTGSNTITHEKSPIT